MNWLSGKLPEISVFLAVAFIAHLFDRIKQVEKRFDSRLKDVMTTLNQIKTALLHLAPAIPGGQPPEDVGESLRIVGRRLANHNPALRRVLTFSISVSLPNFFEQTGITADELGGVSGTTRPGSFLARIFNGDEEWRRILFCGAIPDTAMYFIREISGHFKQWSSGNTSFQNGRENGITRTSKLCFTTTVLSFGAWAADLTTVIPGRKKRVRRTCSW